MQTRWPKNPRDLFQPGPCANKHHVRPGRLRAPGASKSGEIYLEKLCARKNLFQSALAPLFRLPDPTRFQHLKRNGKYISNA